MTRRRVETKSTGRGKGGLKKAIHLRRNGWGIGDYDSFNRDGEIVVGQLAHIDMETGFGTFRGFVLGDQTGQRKEGQEREWSHMLTLSAPITVHPKWVATYEIHVRNLYGND